MMLFSFLTINSSFAQWTIPNLDSLNNQNTNFSTYESKDSNLKIDYPSDWVLAENSSTAILNFVLKQQVNQGGKL